AAGLGLGLATRRRPWPAAACALFILFLFVVAVGPTRLLFVRYCMPIVPALAALAAAGLVLATDELRRGFAPRTVTLVLLVAVVAAAVPPAVRLAQADIRL